MEIRKKNTTKSTKKRRKKKFPPEQSYSFLPFRELEAPTAARPTSRFLSADLSQDASKHSCGRFQRHSVYPANMPGRSPEMRLRRCYSAVCARFASSMGLSLATAGGKHGLSGVRAGDKSRGNVSQECLDVAGNGNRKMDRDRTIPGPGRMPGPYDIAA